MVAPAREGLAGEYAGWRAGRAGWPDAYDELGADARLRYLVELAESRGGEPGRAPSIHVYGGDGIVDLSSLELCDGVFASPGTEFEPSDTTAAILSMGTFSGEALVSHLVRPDTYATLNHLEHVGQLRRREIDGVGNSAYLAGQYEGLRGKTSGGREWPDVAFSELEAKDREAFEAVASRHFLDEVAPGPDEDALSLLEGNLDALVKYAQEKVGGDIGSLGDLLRRHDIVDQRTWCGDLRRRFADVLRRHIPTRARLEAEPGMLDGARPEYAVALLAEEVSAAWPTVNRTDAVRWSVCGTPLSVPDLVARVVGPRRLEVSFHRAFRPTSIASNVKGTVAHRKDLAEWVLGQLDESRGDADPAAEGQVGGGGTERSPPYVVWQSAADSSKSPSPAVGKRDMDAVAFAYADTMARLIMEAGGANDLDDTRSSGAGRYYRPPRLEGWRHGLTFCLYLAAMDRIALDSRDYGHGVDFWDPRKSPRDLMTPKQTASGPWLSLDSTRVLEWGKMTDWMNERRKGLSRWAEDNVVTNHWYWAYVRIDAKPGEATFVPDFPTLAEAYPFMR